MGKVEKEKLYSLQALRAFAAWIVVFHHFSQIFLNFKCQKFSSLCFLGKKGAVGVDIFFALSGFVMVFITYEFYEAYKPFTKEGKNPLSFLQDRLRRIVPAYWFFTLIICALILWLPSWKEIFSMNFGIKEFIFSLCFIPHLYLYLPKPWIYPVLRVGWTLNYEMFFYVIFAMSLFLKRSIRTFLVISFLVILPFLPYKHNTVLGMFFSNHILWAFAGGMLLGILYKERKNYFRPVTGTIALLLGIILLFFINRKDWSFVGILAVYAFLSYEKIITNIKPVIRNTLKYLGDISYSTYLCHVPVICLLFYIKTKNILNSKDLDLSVLFILTLIIVFLVSHLSYKYIERKFTKAS